MKTRGRTLARFASGTRAHRIHAFIETPDPLSLPGKPRTFDPSWFLINMILNPTFQAQLTRPCHSSPSQDLGQ